MPYPGHCTQSPCFCSSLLLAGPPRRCSNTVLSQSLCGVPGSWCAQGLFEPSELLWWLWGLTLNAISPLLLSCWGSSFVFGMWDISSKSLQHHTAAAPVSSLVAQLVKSLIPISFILLLVRTGQEQTFVPDILCLACTLMSVLETWRQNYIMIDYATFKK